MVPGGPRPLALTAPGAEGDSFQGGRALLPAFILELKLGIEPGTGGLLVVRRAPPIASAVA